MKKIIRSAVLILLAFAVSGILGSCGLRAYKGDLRFRYDFDLLDYLKTGKYSGLEVYVGNTDVTTEEIKNVVKRNNVFGNDWTDITDRPCAEGDIVGVSYQGYRKGESGELDEPIEELCKGYRLGEPTDTAENLSESSSTTLSIVLGADELFPGFDKQITGQFSVGDRKTLTYTMPEPCWDYPDLAGETIKMDVLLTYIQEIDYPDEGHTYATDAGFEDLSDYEMSVSTQLIKNRPDQVDNYVKVRVWKQINDNFTVKQYPEAELKESIDAIRDAYEKTAERQKITLDEYVKDYLGLNSEEFDARVEKEAKESVKDEMIVYYIARKEQIGVDDLDFEEKVEEMMEEDEFSSVDQYVRYTAYYYNLLDSDDEMTEEIMEHARNLIKQTILFNKVDDFILEKTVRK